MVLTFPMSPEFHRLTRLSPKNTLPTTQAQGATTCTACPAGQSSRFAGASECERRHAVDPLPPSRRPTTPPVNSIRPGCGNKFNDNERHNDKAIRAWRFYASRHHNNDIVITVIENASIHQPNLGGRVINIIIVSSSCWQWVV